MIKTLDDFSLIDLLPDNLKNDSDVSAIAVALDPLFKEVYEKISLVTFYDGIPDILLDFIAYGENVDFYDSNMTIEQKRGLINKADFFSRHKGTPAAIEDLISTVFEFGKVVEWFEYGGQPGYFKVLINISISQNEIDTFLKLLNSVKRATALLEALEFLTIILMQMQAGTKNLISVTRNTWMNNGGIKSIHEFMDETVKRLDGSWLLNDESHPDFDVQKVISISVNRMIPYAINQTRNLFIALTRLTPIQFSPVKQNTIAVTRKAWANNGGMLSTHKFMDETISKMDGSWDFDDVGQPNFDAILKGITLILSRAAQVEPKTDKSSNISVTRPAIAAQFLSKKQETISVSRIVTTMSNQTLLTGSWNLDGNVNLNRSAYPMTIKINGIAV